MAKFHDVNTVVGANGGAEFVYRLLAVLIAAGWTKPADSDGTTYSSSGGQVTGYATGTNGLNNARAWVRLQEPGGRREWLFQRDTSTNEHQWRICYSAAAKFTGGSPGATQTPSATDEQIILGGGSHASPTFAQLVVAGGGYRAHLIAQSTVVGGCYGFWALTTVAGTGYCNTAILQEPLWDNSYPAEDTDPCLLGVKFYAGAYNVLGNHAGLHWVGRFWTAYGLGGASFRSKTWADPPALPVSPYNAKFVKQPMYVIETSQAWKGVLRHREYCSVSTHAYPDTYDLTTDAKVVIGYSLVPWPENVAPIL